MNIAADSESHADSPASGRAPLRSSPTAARRRPGGGPASDPAGVSAAGGERRQSHGCTASGVGGGLDAKGLAPLAATSTSLACLYVAGPRDNPDISLSTPRKTPKSVSARLHRLRRRGRTLSYDVLRSGRLLHYRGAGHVAGAAAFGQNAEAAGHFLIGFLDTAEIAPESVLVHDFIGGDVP